MAFCLDNGCEINLNSRCVFYESTALPNTGINTNDSLQIALQKIDAVINTGGGGSAVWGDITGNIEDQTDLINYLDDNYYPLSNPDNYISRTGISAGTGISYNNLTGVITNSAPDQAVVLTPGTGISVSGTYPNFTITNTAPSLGGDMILAAAQTSTGKKSFTSDGTNEGFRLIPFAGNPSGSTVGGMWFNSTEDAYFGKTTSAGNIIFTYSTGFVTNGIAYFVGPALDGAISQSAAFTFNGTTLFAPTLHLSGSGTLANFQLGTIAGDASTSLSNSQMWYNSSIHRFRGRQNGANVSFITTGDTVAVANGGTGLTTIPALSIWVANTLNTVTTVTPSAGQSIRVNAGGTAWEAFTPGSGGITNSAANNELMKSDGTNAISSGVFNPSSGNLTLGSGSISGNRTISVESSAAFADLNIYCKSAGNVNFGHSSTTTMLYSSISRAIGFVGGASSIEGAPNIGGAGYDLTILSGASTATTAGNVYITSGNGTPSFGNIVIGSGGGGSITNFQNMQRGLALFNVAAEPSAAIADSVAVYSVDNAGSTIFGLRTETAPIPDVSPSFTHLIPIKYNGTVYYLVATDTP